MARKYRSPHIGGTQMPLIAPESTWKPPSDLPDLRRCGRIAVDVENRDDGLAAGRGSGWPYKAGHLCGVAVAWKEGGGAPRALYAPTRHPDGDCLDTERVSRWLDDHLKCPDLRVVMHHCQHDIGWLRADWGLMPPVNLDDTEGMAAMIDENRLSYKLDDLCAWRGIPGKDEALLREALAAYGYPSTGDRIKGNLYHLPARYAGPYAEQDAISTLTLADDLEPIMHKEGTYQAYLLEMAIAPMVHEMRRRGIRVDVAAAEQARDELFKRRDRVLEELGSKLGERVTIKDVGRPSWKASKFDANGIAYPKTAKGAPSFQGGNMGWMGKSSHWLPRLIVQINKYDDAAGKMQNHIIDYAHRGRLHAAINQYRGEEGGARTQRFSYADPPLQQQAIRDKEIGPMVRGVFLPDDGEVWCKPDYCYDDKTEILTENGWMLFKDLKQEKVAQWKNGVVSFVRPTAKYVGPKRRRRMVHLHMRSLDFCVTENHRCVAYANANYGDGRIDIFPASDLAGKVRNRTFPQAGMLPGGRTVPKELVQLIVALQADAADRPLKYNQRDWCFYIKKERKIKRLLGLLKVLGIAHVQKKNYRRQGESYIGVREDPRFRQFLKPGKVFNLQALMRLTPALRKVFLDELPLWDGHGKLYGSVTMENHNVVQAVAACTNYRASTRIWPKRWTSSWAKQPFATTTLCDQTTTMGSKKTKVTTKVIHGRVYCVTVPSGFIITRHSGHVIVSSNSQQEYRLIVHFADQLGLPGAAYAAKCYREDLDTDFHLHVMNQTGLDRDSAKSTNFAKAYRAGVKRFAELIEQSEESATEIYARYDQELPFVAKLGERCQQLAEQRGWIRLLDGAVLHFDRWEPAWRDGPYTAPMPHEKALEWSKTHDNKRIKRAFCYHSVNGLVQGSAARQVKKAMLLCWQEGRVPMLQLHDELDFSVLTKQDGERVAELMREAVTLRVPVRVDVKYGATWADAKHTWEQLGKEP